MACRLAGLIGLFLTYVPPHLLSKWLLGRSNWPPVPAPRRADRGSPSADRGHRSTAQLRHRQPYQLARHFDPGRLDRDRVHIQGRTQVDPLLGWIADQNRTLYIDRAARRDLHGQVRHYRSAGHLSRWPFSLKGRRKMDATCCRFEDIAGGLPPPRGRDRPTGGGRLWRPCRCGRLAQRRAGMANFRRVLGRRGTMPVTIRLLGRCRRR